MSRKGKVEVEVEVEEEVVVVKKRKPAAKKTPVKKTKVVYVDDEGNELDEDEIAEIEADEIIDNYENIKTSNKRMKASHAKQSTDLKRNDTNKAALADTEAFNEYYYGEIDDDSELRDVMSQDLEFKENLSNMDVESMEGEFYGLLNSTKDSTRDVLGECKVEEFDNLAASINEATSLLKRYSESASNNSLFGKLTSNFKSNKIINDYCNRRNLDKTNKLTMVDVIDDMFKVFSVKEHEIQSMAEKVENLSINLFNQTRKLEIYKQVLQGRIDDTNNSVAVKAKLMAMQNRAISQIQTIRSLNETHISTVLELTPMVLDTLTKLMPELENVINGNLSAQLFIKSLNDTIETINGFEGFAKDMIKKTKEQNYHCVKATYKAMSSNVNTKFYEDSHNDDMKQLQELSKAKTEFVKQVVTTNIKLNELDTKSKVAMLEHKQKQRDAVALLENKNKVVQHRR